MLMCLANWLTMPSKFRRSLRELNRPTLSLLNVNAATGEMGRKLERAHPVPRYYRSCAVSITVTS